MDTNGNTLQHGVIYDVAISFQGTNYSLIGTYNTSDERNYFLSDVLVRLPKAEKAESLMIPKRWKPIFQRFDDFDFDKLKMGGRKTRVKRRRPRKNRRKTRRRY